MLETYFKNNNTLRNNAKSVLVLSKMTPGTINESIDKEFSDASIYLNTDSDVIIGIIS